MFFLITKLEKLVHSLFNFEGEIALTQYLISGNLRKMAANVDQGILNFLEAAVDDKIENFDVKVHDGNAMGEGFLGEMTFVSLKNKKTGKDINLVIKQVRFSGTDKTRDLMTATYVTEIQYYTKIFPAFLNFQKSFPGVREFDNFPKCYATSLESGFEKLALENLKFQNYQTPPKQEPLDPKSFEKLFKIYGELHALGFAFKHHQPEEFLELTKDLSNNWLNLINNDMMDKQLKSISKKVKENLVQENEEKLIVDKLQRYVDDPLDIYLKCVSYKGPNGTILHGDCWSNNLMIKYDSSRDIEHIKMVDFQIGFVGSPVLDLCYSFYAGAGKESLDKLEHLLKVYHNALSETLKKYGCDPEKIYPYELLKKDWKKYSPFGFIMGALLWMTKLITNLGDMPRSVMNDVMDHTNEFKEATKFEVKYNEEKFKKVSVDLVRHMHENELL